MTRSMCGLLLTLTALTGCRRQAVDQTQPTVQAPGATAAERHLDPPDTVEVEEGMLRDLRITTRTVESRPGGDLVMVHGELAVDQRAYAEVGTPVAARVTRLWVNAGDTVRRDQPLAELTSPELGHARADYLSLSARLDLAQAVLERKRGLAAEKIVPLREVQEAESAAAEARAALRGVRATIAAFGVDPLSNDAAETSASSAFTLRAPFPGSAIERAAVLGQMLDPAVPAFKIGNLSTLWLTVHAFERDAVRLRPGVRARLAFPAIPGRDFAGIVTAVGGQVDRESRTVPVRIDVKNADLVLRPGMSATATVPVGASDASMVAVPVAAVQRVRNEWCVFLPKDASHFEIRRIGRGRDLGSEVEVLSGVRPGDRIVVDGAFLLKAQAEKSQADHQGR